MVVGGRFQIGLEICVTSRDPQQDIWVAPGVGPVEAGDSIFLVALPCPSCDFSRCR